MLNNYSYFLSEQDKDLKRALEMSKKVMESEPGNATYIDTYGWILFKLGLYKEAKEQLVRAISLDSTGSEEEIEAGLYSIVACRAAIKAGDYVDDATARALLEKVFELEDPSCPHGRTFVVTLEERELRLMVGRTQ